MGALQGTAALVTGASSGIGAQTALALSEAGADVCVVARRRDRLDTVAKEIRATGGEVAVVGCDVTVYDHAQKAVDRAVAELGRLDILVNNAGVMLLGDIEDAPVEEWQHMMHVNLAGTFHFVKAALPYLLRSAENSPREVADIVNVSSVAGRLIRHGGAVYSATKHGVVAFAESLRQEVTSRYVRVGVVEPGVADTELYAHNRPEALIDFDARLGRMRRLRPDDVADAIHYMVTRPRHASVNELLIRPTEQQDRTDL